MATICKARNHARIRKVLIIRHFHLASRPPTVYPYPLLLESLEISFTPDYPQCGAGKASSAPQENPETKEPWDFWSMPRFQEHRRRFPRFSPPPTVNLPSPTVLPIFCNPCLAIALTLSSSLAGLIL